MTGDYLNEIPPSRKLADLTSENLSRENQQIEPSKNSLARAELRTSDTRALENQGLLPKVDIFSEAGNVSNSGKSTSIDAAEILQKPMLSGPEKIAMRGGGDLDPLLISKTIRNDIVYMVENQKRGPEAIEDYVERRLNDLYKLNPHVAWDTQFQLHGTVLNPAGVPIAQTFPNSVLHLKFDRTNLRWQAEVTPFAPVFDSERRAMQSNLQPKSPQDAFEQFKSKLEFVDRSLKFTRFGK